MPSLADPAILPQHGVNTGHAVFIVPAPGVFVRLASQPLAGRAAEVPVAGSKAVGREHLTVPLKLLMEAPATRAATVLGRYIAHGLCQ